MESNGAQSFGQFLKNYGKGLGQTLTHPLALLPTLLICGIWIALGLIHTKMGESSALSVLNFFTFAQGGLFGGVAGAVGGILGKILVATLVNALLMPLFVKEIQPFARFGQGFKGVFKSFSFDSLRALSIFLMGMGIALLVYSFFNITQRWQESLVGITAAILLIRSIGQRGGLLFSLLFSMVSAFSNGKTPSYIGVTRFLTGMVTGMTLGVGLSAFGLHWCIAFAFGSLLLAFIFVFFGKKQRAALVTASLAALLLIPVHAQDDQQKKKLTDILNQANDAASLSEGMLGGLGQIEDLARQTESQDIVSAQGTYRAMERVAEGMESSLAGGNLDDLLNNLGGLDLSSFGVPEGTIDESIGNLFDRIGTGDDDDDSSFPFSFGNDRAASGEGDSGSFGEQVKETLTEGWADEESHLDDPTETTLIETVGGVAAGLAGAAGAGGAAGGSLGGGGSTSGGGDPLPDLPDGSEPAESPEARSEDEDDESESEEEEPATEGGSGEDEEETSDQEPREGTDEDPQSGDEEGFEDEEEYRRQMEEYERQVKDLEQERTEREQQQAETDRQYKEAYDKDAEKYRTSSSEEKVNEQVEKAREKTEAAENERIRQDKVRETAEKHGVSATNPDGSPKDIDALQKETIHTIKEQLHWDNYKDELFVQQLLNEEELEYSLLDSDAALIDEVSENTVNILGEGVPGGRTVKNAHNFLKAVGKNASEAYNKGGDWKDIGKAAAVGSAEGGLSVLQNQAGDIQWAKYGGTLAKLGGEATAVIGAEGAKVLIHELADGSSPDEALNKALTATGQKAAYFGVSKAFGKLFEGSDKLGTKIDPFNKDIGKLVQDGGSSFMTETTHNYFTSDKIKDLMESYENYRDGKAGDLFYSNE